MQGCRVCVNLGIIRIRNTKLEKIFRREYGREGERERERGGGSGWSNYDIQHGGKIL